MYYHTGIHIRGIGERRQYRSSVGGSAIPCVVVGHITLLGAPHEVLLPESAVDEQRLDGDPFLPYTGPGAHTYAYLDLFGGAPVFVANPTYAGPYLGKQPAPSTPSSSPYYGNPNAPTPPPAAAPAAQSSGASLSFGMPTAQLSAAGLQAVLSSVKAGMGIPYGSWMSAVCEHESVADTGMGVAYCKDCPAKLRFINMEWVALPNEAGGIE